MFNEKAHPQFVWGEWIKVEPINFGFCVYEREQREYVNATFGSHRKICTIGTMMKTTQYVDVVI